MQNNTKQTTKGCKSCKSQSKTGTQMCATRSQRTGNGTTSKQNTTNNTTRQTKTQSKQGTRTGTGSSTGSKKA